MSFLKVAVEDIRKSFNLLELSLDHVHFVKGFFQHSLPGLRVRFRQENRKLAVLRGDGDMYESYMDILYNLYEFVPVGGYFICDDCGNIDVAQKAIDNFRKAHGIRSPLVIVEGAKGGMYWKKDEATEVLYGEYVAWNATRHGRGSSLQKNRKQKPGNRILESWTPHFV